MFPIVQEMVDRMCEEAKTEMKTMNQDELGSWSRAVTSADGAWMTLMLCSAPPFSQPSNECFPLYKKWLTECVKKLKQR